MDEIVLQGMAKWPNVPAAYGWLSLDRRGQWLLKGDVIRNPAIIAFIGRNYEHDDRGCWFFQNGPQRVFVELDAAPLVFRWTGEAPLWIADHIGRCATSLLGAWMDDAGNLFLRTEHGPGIVDDRDLELFAETLRGPGGRELDDQALESLMGDVAGRSTTECSVTLGPAQVNLATLPAFRVPDVLGFIRRPAP